MEMKVCVEKTGGLMVLADTFSQVGRERGREGGRAERNTRSAGRRCLTYLHIYLLILFSFPPSLPPSQSVFKESLLRVFKKLPAEITKDGGHLQMGFAASLEVRPLPPSLPPFLPSTLPPSVVTFFPFKAQPLIK